LLEIHVDKPTWKSQDEVVINGICVVCSKLKDGRVGNNIENESYFDNKTSTYITNRLCSVNNDGSSPWIVTANNIDDFAKIFVRGDNETKLAIIMNMTKYINYNWYPSWGVSPYNDTTLNIEEHKGSQSTVMTLITSGTSQNVELTSREENRDELWNDVLVCGYGDGINQIKSRCLSSSVNKTKLSSDITASATTATVDDGTKLAASGTLVIGCEKIVFTRVGNTLTLTRSSATFLDGTNVTETYNHNAGIAVYDYNAPTSPEASSSVDTYGHKASPPQTDRSIMDQNTLDRVAQIILDEHDEELIRIEVIAMDMYDILDTVVIGDYVTITEPEVGNDGDYRVVGFEIDEYELKIVCSNVPRIISETIASVEEQEKNLNYYAQGATNIYAVHHAENCDSSTALNMRFPIPAEAIGINKILLNFKIKKFRYYTGTTPSGGGSTSGASSISTTVTGGGSTPTSTVNTNPAISDAVGHHGAGTGATGTSAGVWSGNLTSVTIGTYDAFGQLHSMFITNSSGSDYNADVGDVFIRLYNSTDGTYFPDTTGTQVGYGGWRNRQHTGATIFTPGSNKNDTIRGQIKTSITSTYQNLYNTTYNIMTHTHDVTLANHDHGMEHTHSTPAHNHTMTPQMQEGSLATGDLVVTAGTEGSETSVGTYDVSSISYEQSVDITSNVKNAITLGSLSWINVKFAPVTELMRIECSTYIQIFIRST